MPTSLQMTDQQEVAISVDILDADGQPFESLPPGSSVTFVSSNPDVLSVTVRPSGLVADIGSGKVGTATIDVTATGFSPPISPSSDSVTIQVINSLPGKMNLTVGAPTEEPLPPPTARRR